MPVTVTDWGRRIDELLADGEWHEREELIQAAIPMVPPGLAYRRGEAERRKNRAGRVGPAGRIVGSRGVSVAAGARSLARQAVRTRLRRGTAVRWGSRIRKASP